VRGPLKDNGNECNKILLADSPSITFEQKRQGLTDIAYANAPAGKYTPGANGRASDVRHGTGSVCVFGDGHAMSYTPDRLLTEIPILEKK
jgi:prepilin-type processing-associated H-X9-DG protein